MELADPGDGARPRPIIFPSAAQGARQFVGREWVLDLILDWMDNGTERFLLLVGEPGWGKSSLCARIVGPGRALGTARGRRAIRRVSDAIDAAYLCSSTSASTNNPTTFARSIAEQLAHRYPEFAAAILRRAAPGQFNVTITADEIVGRAIGILARQIFVESPDPRDVYEQSVRLPLADAMGADDRTFILVDGLDDALRYQSPIAELVATSTDFPEGVRFLLTTRPEERVVRRFVGTPGVRIEVLSDDSRRTLNEEDIRAYVETRLDEPGVAAWAARANRSPDEFVTDLVSGADGNMLFTRLLLDNPPSAGAAEVGVPRGLDAAYDEFLGRLMPNADAFGGDPTWAQAVRPVLGSIAVSVPAAPEDDLARWVGGRDPVDTTLSMVGQLTELVDAEGDARRLYHRSLGDFLVSDRLPPVAGLPRRNRFYVAPRDRHEAIARYYLTAIGTEWDGDWARCDAYGLRRLIPHLHALHGATEPRAERARLARQLCDIALDPGFQVAQRTRLGDGSATIEAVRLALEVCADSGDPDAIRRRVRVVATSWEPDMRALAARSLAELGRRDRTATVDELKALLR